MRKSTVISVVAAVGAGAAAYYFATTHGDTLRTQVQQRTRESGLWLRAHQRDLHERLHRIEGQIADLGDEMRGRLDAIAQQAAGVMQPGVEIKDWTIEGEDVQHDLRSLPRRP